MTLVHYMPLLRLAMQSIGAGFVMVLFLHYVLPFAEHPRILNTVGHHG